MPAPLTPPPSLAPQRDSSPPAAPQPAPAPPVIIDPRKVEAVLAHRELARRHYRHFLKLWTGDTRQSIQWNWHIDYLADIMQAVAEGDAQMLRVLINIPPRFWKSTIISQLWQAWMIGRDDSPASSLLSCGVSADLAVRDSRKTIQVLKSDWYKTLFPNVELIRSNETEWETKGGAFRNAVGVGGTVTGRGGAHLTFDDILKADDANSDTVRDRTNEWLGETFLTRLNDPRTGTITGIMQRLHERDPTGYLLEQSARDGASQYVHIVLPLIAPQKTFVSFRDTVYTIREKGELLHPARIDEKVVRALQAAMRANFDGQYQQNPSKMQGGALDPTALIRSGDDALSLVRKYGLTPSFYIDFAATEKQTQRDDPDYSVITVAAVDTLNRLIFLDVFREQCSHDTLATALIALHKKWRPRYVKGEKGALLTLFQPVLMQQMRLQDYYFALMPLANRTRDKVARSSALQGLLSAGMVVVPASAPWLLHFERELRGFPLAAHDDIVDTASDAALDFEGLRPGVPEELPPENPHAIKDIDQQERQARIHKAYNRHYLQQYEQAREKQLDSSEQAELAASPSGW